MNEIKLRVGPAATGWAVDCDVLEPTFFRSGARAEAVARRLAIHLSGAGHDVHVQVQDRMEQVVATQRYFGDYSSLSEPAHSGPVAASA